MYKKRPLLSICVPTYNGGGRIKQCIDALIQSVQGHNNIEIIISDNCSEDNTAEILALYKNVCGVTIYRNSANVGLNGNLKLIIKKYASGQYCWIIGDDDIVDIDAISKIVSIIEKEIPSFVSVRHRLLSQEGLKQFSIRNDRTITYSIAPYFECIDKNASDSNVLGTFMSSQIFMLDRIRNFDMSILGDNDWVDFRKVFPNSFMMTSIFHNDNQCCYIKIPIITALVHNKTWDDKLRIISTKILPSYYNYCVNLAANKYILPNNCQIITINKTACYLKALLSLQLSYIDWRDICSLSYIRNLSFVFINKIRRAFGRL